MPAVQLWGEAEGIDDLCGGVGELGWVGVLGTIDLQGWVCQGLEFVDDPFNARPGFLLSMACDRDGGEHDGQMGFEHVFLMMKDRPGRYVMLGDPETSVARLKFV